MRARDVVGRKIVRVEQAQAQWLDGGPEHEILRVVLDNGTWLWFSTCETEDQPIVCAHVGKPRQ